MPAFQELTDFGEDDDVNVISPRLVYKAQRGEERGRSKQPGEVTQGHRINFTSESWRFTSQEREGLFQVERAEIARPRQSETTR